MKVPFVDLSLQHSQISDELNLRLGELFREQSWVLGPEVSRFEGEFARYMNVSECVGVANGTDALELAVRALSLEPEEEVLVPANSFIASAAGVLRAGARVRFVDCDPEHGLLDVEDARRRATARTRAVMPVHLYGQAAPMESVLALAKEKGWFVLEDAAQAQGARRGGASVGTFGDLAATSFYPGKNLGAYGDGGAVLTRSRGLAEKVRLLRNHGSPAKYAHPELGFNSRLDSLQAAVLSVKLTRLEAWNAQRRACAERYREQLAARCPELGLPSALPGNEHVWHLFVIRVPARFGRDRVLAELQRRGVGAGIHYPVPIPLQGAFASYGHRAGDFPAAESMAREQLSLPLFPGLTEEQQDYVVRSLRAALDGSEAPS